MHKVTCIVGNRPQFVKQAMFDHALASFGETAPLRSVTINTGQHYDALMSDVFFSELGAAPPAYELGVGSGPILDQIGKMLAPLRQVIEAEAPDAVVLFGDTNSTLAGAIAAAHHGIPCVHVEGGERLYRRNAVPEEINRVVSDHLSDLILTSSRKASRYLHREGLGPDRVKYVGDIMFDLFKAHISRVDALARIGPADYGVEPGSYMLATIHRVENTSSDAVLTGLLDELDNAPMPVLLPMHPRIKHLLASWGWAPKDNLRLIEPLGYFDFLALLRDASLIVSDSGGVTREALFAGKGCIVPLDSCWWTEAVEADLAIAVGQNKDALRDALNSYRPDAKEAMQVVAREFGDGQSAHRIIAKIASFLDERKESQQSEGAWHRLGHFNEIPPASGRTDFTYDAYRHMLSTFQGAGYEFGPFALPKSPRSPLCLLRHDIDFDLEKACEMARLEAELGVKATYFLMLSSDHYNLMSADSRRQVAQIAEAGHWLGLHFDETAYGDMDDPAEYRAAITKEADILAAVTGAPVDAVSFHRPSKLVLSGDPTVSHPLLHSYDRRLQDLADYVSDSGGVWKYGMPTSRNAFALRRLMQVLVHPIWWNEAPVSRVETLLTLLDTRRERDEVSFARNCRPFRIGHLNRDITYGD